MLRPANISKPFKQRLVINYPANNQNSMTPPLNVQPLVRSIVINQNVKSNTAEIKPLEESLGRLEKNRIQYKSQSRDSIQSRKIKSKSRVRINTQNFKHSDKKEQISKLIHLFLNILDQKQVFHGKFPQNAYIKLQTLKTLLEYISASFISKSRENFNYLSSIFSQIGLSRYLKDNGVVSGIKNDKKLRIDSGLVRISINHVKKSTANPNLLKSQITVLQETIFSLKDHKNSLQNQIKATIIKLDQTKREFQIWSNKVQALSAQSAKMQSNIKEQEALLKKIESFNAQIYQFRKVNSNQLMKENAENFKNHETEMFKLNDLVSHSSNGNKDFHKSITIWDIEKRMEPELKMFNKFLTQNTNSSYQQKCKELKDFLAKIKTQYSKIYEQLFHVIEQKSKYIKRFVECIELWEQSYLQKTEFLVKIRKTFSYHCVKLDEIKQFYHSQTSQKENSSICQKVFTQAQNIINLFKIGNYFY